MALSEVSSQSQVKSTKESRHLVLNQAIANLADVVGQAEGLLLKVQGGDPPDETKENEEIYSLARVLATAPERLDALGMRLKTAVSALREELF